MNMYVGNFSYDLTEENLMEIFGAYGHVESVKIIKDKISGESRGFGFIEMPDKNQAKAAMGGIREIEGRTITINEARPLEKRFNTGRGGFGSGKKKRGGRQRNSFEQRSRSF